jgi:hypothetical protein
MTATAGYLFEGADWDFSKLQRIHDACDLHAIRSKFWCAPWIRSTRQSELRCVARCTKCCALYPQSKQAASTK